MTFIVGCIKDNEIILICDSVETRIGLKPTKGKTNSIFIDLTSFQEKGEIDTNSIPLESANKIYKISENCIAAYSGEVRNGESLIEQLKYLCEKEQSLIETIPSYFEQWHIQNNELVVGIIEGNNRYLIGYYPGQAVKIHNGKKDYCAVYLGKMTPQTSQITRYLFENFWPLNAKHFMICLISLIRNNFYLQNGINKGVGGFFNGAILSKSGLQWNDDTLYVLYSVKNFENGDRFSSGVLNRNGFCFIISNSFRKVVSKTNLSTEEEQEVKKLFDRTTQNIDYKYLVFMSYDQSNMAIIDTEYNYSHLLEYQIQDRQIYFSFSKEFLDTLKFKPNRELFSGFSLSANFISNTGEYLQKP